MAKTTLPVLNGGIVELSTTELTKSINELAGQVKELVEDNKKSSAQDEKQTQSLEALSKNFSSNRGVSTSQRNAINNASNPTNRAQSLLNLSASGIMRATAGDLRDRAIDRFQNNSLVRFGMNVTNAYRGFTGRSPAGSRRELTQSQLEDKRENVERQETTNDLLKKILEALLKGDALSTNINTKKISESLFSKIPTELIATAAGVGGIGTGILGKTLLDNLKKQSDKSKKTTRSLVDGFTNFNRANEQNSKDLKKAVDASKPKLGSAPKSGGSKSVFKRIADNMNALTGNIGKTTTKLIKFGGIFTAGLSGVLDGISVMEKKYDASKVSKFIAGFIAGDEKVDGNTFWQSLKWGSTIAVAGGAIGASKGAIGGPVGALAGGLAGAALGVLVATVGDEKIAKSADEVGNYFSDAFENVTSSFMGLIDRLTKPVAAASRREVRNRRNSYDPLANSISGDSNNRVSGGGTGGLTYGGLTYGIDSDSGTYTSNNDSIIQGKLKKAGQQDTPSEKEILNNNLLGDAATVDFAGKDPNRMRSSNAVPLTSFNPSNYIGGPAGTSGLKLSPADGTSPQARAAVFNLLKIAEGFSSDPYPDGDGYAVGYGDNFDKDRLLGVYVNQPEKGKRSKAVLPGTKKLRVPENITFDESLFTNEKDAANKLRKTISTYEKEFLGKGDRYKNIYDSLSTNRKTVLLSMAFQLGIPKLLLYTQMFDALEKGDYKEAALQIINSSEFRKGGGHAKRQQNNADAMEGDTLLEGASTGNIAFSKQKLLVGDYTGVKQNPELTLALSDLRDNAVATVQKMNDKNKKDAVRDIEIQKIAYEKSVELAVKKSLDSEMRIRTAEGLNGGGGMNGATIPFINNVVDNTQIQNTNQSVLLKTEVANRSNSFLMHLT